MILALVVWVGGLIFFALVMAPALFAIVPSHQMAGAVVGRTLTLLHWIGFASGVVYLCAALFSGRWRGRGTAAILVAVMMVLTLGSQLGVSRKLASLQSEMRVIDEVPVTDARRVAFNRLHAWSTRMEGTVLLLGLVVVFLSARREEQDRYSRWN